LIFIAQGNKQNKNPLAIVEKCVLVYSDMICSFSLFLDSRPAATYDKLVEIKSKILQKKSIRKSIFTNKLKSKKKTTKSLKLNHEPAGTD
jgi:hypothetical protein